MGRGRGGERVWDGMTTSLTALGCALAGPWLCSGWALAALGPFWLLDLVLFPSKSMQLFLPSMTQ